MSQIYNFSAGPAVLPRPVLQQVRDELVEYPGAGVSLLEMSHRSTRFAEINASAEAGIRELLGLPASYHVLFLQGGASLQFSMVPTNLLSERATADYIITGIWSKKALQDAMLHCPVRVAATTESGNFRRIPRQEELDFNSYARYVHITTNNTIFGTQWAALPETGAVPLVADASSDILSRPIDVMRYGLIYAGAQKNIGPAGVTLVIVREDMLRPDAANLPAMLNYRVHMKNKSLYNTPNTFGIYMVDLVCKWIKSMGGLAGMREHNERKAQVLYDVIDSTEFYHGHAEPASRSRMNVTFRLPSPELEKQFLQEATAQGFVELKGHRDVGGLRASIYNAFPMEGVAALAAFMREFERRNG